MQNKTLTSLNGKLLQLTLTPWECAVLRAFAANASITTISRILRSDDQAVGQVVSDFYIALKKMEKNVKI